MSMPKHRPNHMGPRRKGRDRPRRARHFLAAALSIGFFCILILVAAIGLTSVYREPEHKTGGNVQTSGVQKTTGQIVVVGVNDHCRKTDFNNLTGQFSDGQSAPCPKPADPNEYDYPTNRLEGIAKGFSKGRR